MDVPTASPAGVPDPLPDALVVLDVREQNEWAAGRVEGSVPSPLVRLGERFADLPAGPRCSSSAAPATAPPTPRRTS